MAAKGTTSPKRILVVDDSPDVARRTIAALREQLDCEVLGPAADGEEALRAFAQYRPAAVVLDLQLRGPDGLAVLAGIRRLDPGCVVVFLTNHESGEFRQRCLRAGANFFLRKSRDFERLPEILETALT